MKGTIRLAERPEPLPYAPDAQCPKCSTTFTARRYVTSRGRHDGLISFVRYQFGRDCPTCGYSWQEQTGESHAAPTTPYQPGRLVCPACSTVGTMETAYCYTSKAHCTHSHAGDRLHRTCAACGYRFDQLPHDYGS